MARVTTEDCITSIPNRFQLVIYSCSRARELLSGNEANVAVDNDKQTVIALREIAEETITVENLKNDLIEEYQTTTFTEDEDINEIEVIDPVQIIPYTVVDEKNSKVVADDSMKDEKLNSNTEINPLNSPIVDGLAKRTEERKIKLKEFNYKFVKQRKVEDMENEPASKRAGIDLDESFDSSVTLSSLDEDIDGNLDINSKNSFLHDNVD